MTLRAVFLFVRENLGLTVGKDKCQFVRKPLPVMQDFGSVFFLFFPMVREFHGAPVGNVTIFSFTEYAIEHSGGAEQSDMATMWARSGDETTRRGVDLVKVRLGRGFGRGRYDVRDVDLGAV